MTKPALRQSLRQVTPDTVISVEMHEAIEAMCHQCIAAGPVAVVLVWEVPVAVNGVKVFCQSVPDSEVLRRGMVDVLFDQQHPEVAE